MGIPEWIRDGVLVAAGLTTIYVQIRKDRREDREERRKRELPPE